MNFLTRPKAILIIVCLLVLAGYSMFQARFLIMGPKVLVMSPRNGDVVEDHVVTIEGQATNIARISLNDRQIYTDEAGWWSEKLIVSPGISIIKVKASDRFGRETEQNIQVVLPQAENLN